MHTQLTVEQREALLVLRCAVNAHTVSESHGAEQMDDSETRRIISGLTMLKQRGFTADEIQRLDVYRLAVRAGFYTDHP